MASCKLPRTISKLQRFIFAATGYNRFGLLHDDCLEFTEDLKIALHRLPQEEKDLRNYRVLRAFHADMNHTELPKKLWTKIEDDRRYLQPYLDEVIKEREEREDWERNH